MQYNTLKEERRTELYSGFETAFINADAASNVSLRPQFVSNNHKSGKRVLSYIEDELMGCDSFIISVAFITMGGITPLLLTLKELEKKGICGKILTTNYLNFSEPAALQKLHELKNITLKMYDVEAADEGFHTKGYIFKKEEVKEIDLEEVQSASIDEVDETVTEDEDSKFSKKEQKRLKKMKKNRKDFDF